MIEALIEREPRIEEQYERAIDTVERLKRYFQASAGNYRLHGGGDPDLFKAFGERFLALVRTGGALGCVLPRQLLGGSGASALRGELFRNWSIQSADVLWNRRVWAFPAVFHRTRMTLLAARKQRPAPGAMIPSAGPLGDERTFRRARDLRVPYKLTDLEMWSLDLEVPSLPNPRALAVFRTMLLQPRFDNDERAWRAVPYRELDAAADRGLFNENGVGWPVWKGGTFDRYHPDLATPVYWAEPAAALERLQEKRLHSHATFSGLPQGVLSDPSTLPPYDCRIMFRDVVRATDTRSMRSCLAPPKVFAIHDAPQLVWLRGGERDMMVLLAVLNSLPFDWLLRRRVETHVTFGILNALSVPESQEHIDALARLAGRLSCTDDRYSDFADRVGVDCGPLDEASRNELEAEIDAVVARAYHLSEDDFEVIFEDFNENAVSDGQRERIVEFFKASADT